MVESTAVAAAVAASADQQDDKLGPIRGVPMVPNCHWLIGHLGLMAEKDFRVCLHRFAMEHANEKGRCSFWMGPTVLALSVTEPKDVQLLLRVSSSRTMFPLMSVHTHRLFGDRNIGVLNGKEWKRQRSTIVKAFHKAMQEEYFRNECVRKTAGVLVDRIIQSMSDDGVYEGEVGGLMEMLTMDVFGQAALHTDFGCCRQLKMNRLSEAFAFLTTDMMRRLTKDILNPSSHVYSLPTAANRRNERERQYLQSFVSDLVHQRRRAMEQNNQSVPKDLLTQLILAVQEDKDENVSDKSLTDTLSALLFAGYETSSVSLTYVLCMIAQHKDVETRCLEEIGREQRVYLEAVVMETLRLYPPVISTTRSLEKTIELDDEVTVEKGTYLYFPIWYIHRNEKIFPRPEEFCPERWVKRDNHDIWVERDANDEPAGDRRSLVAFSAGARSCAGQRFAMAEMTEALAVLLSQLTFALPPDFVLEPHRPGIVQRPKGGVPMIIRKRE